MGNFRNEYYVIDSQVQYPVSSYSNSKGILLSFEYFVLLGKFFKILCSSPGEFYLLIFCHFIVSPFLKSALAFSIDFFSIAVNGDVSSATKTFQNISARIFSGKSLSMLTIAFLETGIVVVGIWFLFNCDQAICLILLLNCSITSCGILLQQHSAFTISFMALST